MMAAISQSYLWQVFCLNLLFVLRALRGLWVHQSAQSLLWLWYLFSGPALCLFEPGGSPLCLPAAPTSLASPASFSLPQTPEYTHITIFPHTHMPCLPTPQVWHSELWSWNITTHNDFDWHCYLWTFDFLWQGRGIIYEGQTTARQHKHNSCCFALFKLEVLLCDCLPFALIDTLNLIGSYNLVVLQDKFVISAVTQSKTVFLINSKKSCWPTTPPSFSQSSKRYSSRILLQVLRHFNEIKLIFVSEKEAATFLSLLDYGDHLYINAPAQCDDCCVLWYARVIALLFHVHDYSLQYFNL